jgi:TolB-like protein/DNA-binding winged helix-turn-helix (wHTH) protein/Tfp pilus assembly protein PilF
VVVLTVHGPLKSSLQFGPFELDLQSAELRKSGTLIKLHGQPLKVLALLAGNPGQLLTREEISREIWGEGTFVDSDQGLNFCIKQIRTFLNDNARTPKYIETLPRRGYRFIAPVEIVREQSGPATEEAPRPALPATASAKVPRRKLLWYGAPLIALALAGIAYLLIATRPFSDRKVMLLVLPFDNISGDAKQEYFSDGMTEEMITHLGRLEPQGLGVIAHSSATRYKFTAYVSRDIADIGRQLGADYVLEGSVRLADGRVRITARLNRVRDRSYVWTESYDRDLRDVLSLQAEVAQDIARQIRVRISRRPLRPARPRQIRADVYDLYLRGRFFFNRRTQEDMTRATSLLAEAVRLDPDYAAAYAGLADAYSGLAHYGALPPREAYLKEKAAASKALALDPELAEAHTALAAMKVEYEWDWQGAQKEFERAIELNPSYPTAHQWYAHYWSAVGTPDRAVVEARQALKLDPLSPLINSALGRHLYHAGRYEGAIAQLRKAIELGPNFAVARLHLGWIYEARGSFGQAISQYETAVTLTGRNTRMVAALARALGSAGRTAEARSLLAELLSRARQQYVSPFDIAMAYAGLGDRNAAFEWLDKAYDERSPSLVYLGRHPWTASLRSDPRFAAMLQRLKLPSQR